MDLDRVFDLVDEYARRYGLEDELFVPVACFITRGNRKTEKALIESLKREERQPYLDALVSRARESDAFDGSRILKAVRRVEQYVFALATAFSAYESIASLSEPESAALHGLAAAAAGFLTYRAVKLSGRHNSYAWYRRELGRPLEDYFNAFRRDIEATEK